jgi:hypothetical protein
MWRAEKIKTDFRDLLEPLDFRLFINIGARRARPSFVKQIHHDAAQPAIARISVLRAMPVAAHSAQNSEVQGVCGRDHLPVAP